MPLACLSLRPLLHQSRDTLSDAERLELEAHLQTCARCRSDVDVIERIRAAVDGAPVRPLAEQRVARAIDGAFERAVARAGADAAGQGGERTVTSRRRTWLLTAAALVPVAAATALLWWSGGADSVHTSNSAPEQPARVIHGEVHAQGRTLTASAPIPSGTPVVATRDATLALGPARVELRPRTELVWDGDALALHLAEGHVALAVAPDRSRRFRVITGAFIVEVVGTRFQVGVDRVSVTEGVVRVLDAGATPIAELRAGDSWTAEPRVPPPAGPAAPALAPVTPDQPAPPAIDAGFGRAVEQRGAGRAAGSETRPDAAQWLARARAALARDRLGEARQAARTALATAPGRDQSAEAHTILAECAQAAGDSAEAIRLYLLVARRYPDLDAGQTALFAAARLEANRDRIVEARALLRRYLRAYPDGPFAGDARLRLRALGKHTEP